jgi:hypothetical protein
MKLLKGYWQEIALYETVRMVGIPNYVRLKNRLSGFRFFHPGFVKTKTIFIHVPKAAGSSIGTTLYDSPSTGHFEWEYYAAEDREKFDDFFKFTFVREPVDRFLSAYNYLLSGGRSAHDTVIGEKIATFGDVEAFIRDGLEQKGFLKLRHLRPQSGYIFDAQDRQMVDFIGRVETMGEDTADLSRQIGIEVNPGRTNTTKKKLVAAADLSNEALHTLSRLYERDFRLLGYPKLSDS